MRGKDYSTQSPWGVREGGREGGKVWSAALHRVLADGQAADSDGLNLSIHEALLVGRPAHDAKAGRKEYGERSKAKATCSAGSAGG